MSTDDFKEKELKLNSINSECEEDYTDDNDMEVPHHVHHHSTNSSDTSQQSSQSTDIDDSKTSVSTTTTTQATLPFASYRRNAFSSSPTVSHGSHHKQASLSLTLKRQSTLSPPMMPRKHTRTPSFPELFLNGGGAKSAPIDLSTISDMDMDGMSMKRKNSMSSRRSWKLKRQMSSDALLNRARSLHSFTNQALVKLKHIRDEEIYRDSDEVKYCKQQLTSMTRELNETLAIANELYAAQCSYVQALQSFSSTVHSCIDLGRNRSIGSGTGNSNKNPINFFGVYMKMMASTMRNVGNLYDEYKIESLREYMVEPLEALLDSPHLQTCVSLRWQYSKVKNTYNSQQHHKDATVVASNLSDLQDIERKFVAETQKLIKMRSDGLIFKFMNLQQSLFEFSVQKTALIRDKTRVNAYDEMKTQQFKMKARVQTEIVHIANDAAFAEYFEQHMHPRNAHNTIVLFHRDKFPPSTQFLMECFAPLCQKSNAQQIDFLRFIIVHHKCTQTIAQYNIDMFPTCLVFENEAPSRAYKAMVGNSKMTQNELQFIVDNLCAKHAHAE
eukprot:CAMPEP_0202693514 /NCGR_PEP_ID=MMETSP1385-20130828/7609_1 /ASSEMBLY_ACC=CAM_ASM_000861 /TAXON_ID=933848 /ORGANISM="Elphidium margaritaceum" /LENGTH=555 /DNA_ID=CAMNT_0049349201 /DNA_START=39 /DNA_END=1706 /DNA_ORIENTATION=+